MLMYWFWEFLVFGIVWLALQCPNDSYAILPNFFWPIMDEAGRRMDALDEKSSFRDHVLRHRDLGFNHPAQPWRIFTRIVRDVQICPPSGDYLRFPPKEYLKDMEEFSYKTLIKIVARLDSPEAEHWSDEKHACYTQARDYLNNMHLVYVHLGHCDSKDWPINRRYYLMEVKERLKGAYFADRLPPPVPFWLFEDLPLNYKESK